MDRRIILSVVFCLMLGKVAAQVTISGYVSDSATGERLPGVTVIDMNTRSGTISNAFGFFSLVTKPAANIIVRFSYVGYKTIKLTISARDTMLNIALLPGVNLEEVQVSAEKPVEDRTEIGTITIPVNEIKRLPALGGEPDIMKALQLLPGVQSGNEGSNGLYVRGGSPDQNLILLDDVPLYYINHLGGFVSTFNPDAISKVTLTKGGFPARYGSRLSSVLDIRMKDGNMKELHGAGTIGMIASKLALEGPIKKDTASYLISYRRFLYDIITRPITKIVFEGASMGYHFYDMNAKFNYKLNENNRLYLSFYNGDDRSIVKMKNKDINQNAKVTIRWGNLLGALRWNHLFNHSLFTNTTFTYTRYRYQTAEYYKQTGTESKYTFTSSIYDATAKTDFEYYPARFLTMRFGGGATLHNFTPTSTTLKQDYTGATPVDSSFNDYKNKAFEHNLYLENEISLNSRFCANIGARYSAYYVDDKWFHGIEPRLVVNYKFARNYSLKATYSKMQQYVHLLTSSGAGMPADYWVPATAVLPPEESVQYAFGLAHTSRNGMFEITIEPFYKTMSNLIAFEEGIAYLGGSGNWQYKVDGEGKSKSYGIDFFLQKKLGKTTGWIGYTLAKTTRQFDNQNDGKTYPYKYDRRHDISIVFKQKLKENIDFSATWVYGTGNAMTLATGHHLVIDDNGSSHYAPQTDFELYEGHIYSEKNSYRMRAYHRLDVGFNFYKKKKWGERVWNISIYNLYNRQNPYLYYWDTKTTYENGVATEGVPKLYQQSLFPIIPSVSYSFRF